MVGKLRVVSGSSSTGIASSFSRLSRVWTALRPENRRRRMYMREMGSVELLTREDELKIAKRIEEGQQQIVKAIARSTKVVEDFIQSFDSINDEAEDSIRLSDLIGGFVDLSLLQEENDFESAASDDNSGDTDAVPVDD